MTRRLLTAALALLVAGAASAQMPQASIRVKTAESAGTIDEKIYGQLFEHIYFSANNGVWQELIYERSFEPDMSTAGMRMTTRCCILLPDMSSQSAWAASLRTAMKSAWT